MEIMAEEECKEFIKKRMRKYKKKKCPIDWESIKIIDCNTLDEAKTKMLELIEDEYLPEGITLEEYQLICNNMEEIEKRAQDCMLKAGSSIIKDSRLDNNTETSLTTTGTWSVYKDRLSKIKHFSDVSIAIIEMDTEKIRKRLTTVYDDSIKSIKGVVVGAVQSGKTANMGALIAQCSECGWNMFIILGGMIENLRQQTENRLIDDLSGEGVFHWVPLNTICERVPDDYQKLSKLRLDEHDKYRYLCIALKHKSRLTNLIKWLKSDSNNAKRLKVLVIDDEADQASVNTGDITQGDKKKIYDLIDQIVNGIDDNGQKRQLCGAMNYICYTATPYANFLNDSNAESLYPNNFIATLTPPNSYFGPQQIFGISEEGYNGLSVIRKIDFDDNILIKQILKTGINVMPKSLKTALLWYLCVIATMRYKEKHRPFSMLINISSKTSNHDIFAKIIIDWFNNYEINDIIEECKIIWEYETQFFSLAKFKNEFSVYPNSEQLDDYPRFDQIKPYLYSLIGMRTQKIGVDQNNQFTYGKGIHICVDNCKNNKITIDNEYLRVSYPDKNELKDMNAPAFIVIGGNTLSRGLTIEGLVTTYFYRDSRQADSLLQMGRWFGYRFGYELYPRIWMNDNTRSQFEFISQLDYNLRMNLNKYMVTGIEPRTVGPLIDNTPAVSWLRITAKNKMQSAIDACYDYTGLQAQTISFDDDINIMRSNVSLTKEFLNSLPSPKKSRTGKSFVWKSIDVNNIYNYLDSFKFCQNNRVFSDIAIFTDWLNQEMNEKYIKTWNVVLVGIDKKSANDVAWVLNDNVRVYKVRRTKKSHISEYINIGVLRSYRDNYEDITEEENSNNHIDAEINKSIKYSQPRDSFELKNNLNLEKKPMLVIYVIDGNPEKQDASGSRVPLHLEEDLIGIYLNIPGENRKNHVSKITVKISEEEKYADEY